MDWKKFLIALVAIVVVLFVLAVAVYFWVGGQSSPDVKQSVSTAVLYGIDYAEEGHYAYVYVRDEESGAGLSARMIEEELGFESGLVVFCVDLERADTCSSNVLGPPVVNAIRVLLNEGVYFVDFNFGGLSTITSDSVNCSEGRIRIGNTSPRGYGDYYLLVEGVLESSLGEGFVGNCPPEDLLPGETTECVVVGFGEGSGTISIFGIGVGSATVMC